MSETTTFLPLTGPNDPRVVDFLDAWHENGRADFEQRYSHAYATGSYDSPTGYAKHACGRRKYICLDCGTGGVMMVEKTTGQVFGIKAYGTIHRGHPLGRIEELAAKYRKATAANSILCK